MELADFLRLFPLRSKGLMWLFGAGTSASAGVPTAWEMMWEFKRALYCSKQRVSLQACGDLASPGVMARIDSNLSQMQGCPAEGSNEDYAYFFEAAYPDERDRRRYIETKLSGASVSFGHRVLAELIKLDHLRLICTTNFDRLIEDATINALGTSAKIVVSTLDSSDTAIDAINENRWPVVMKLHGDFQSKRLKNTSDELRTQDANLRHALIESCKRFGLCVAGYSGRDDSVMDALEEACQPSSFPMGLFWFKRPGNTVFSRVSKLIDLAKSKGIQADTVETETFDELMGDIIQQLPNLPATVQTQLHSTRSRISNAPALPSPTTGWPVLRLNALPIIDAPTICRKVVCEIGGSREVAEAIADAKSDILAIRKNIGVLCFGRDSEVKKTFAAHNVSQFDIHAIEPAKLRYESGELSLLYQALCQALVRHRPLKIEKRRHQHIAYIDSADLTNPLLSPLRTVVTTLCGKHSTLKFEWSEAVRLRMDHKLGRLWLVFEPTIWVKDSPPEAKEFVQKRLVTRYNKYWNDLLNAWACIIAGNEQKTKLQAFGIGDGIDASYELCQITAFCRPQAG